MAYTLLDIGDYPQQQQSNRVITLFRRVHKIQAAMIEQIGTFHQPASERIAASLLPRLVGYPQPDDQCLER